MRALPIEPYLRVRGGPPYAEVTSKPKSSAKLKVFGLYPSRTSKFLNRLATGREKIGAFSLNLIVMSVFISHVFPSCQHSAHFGTIKPYDKTKFYQKSIPQRCTAHYGAGAWCQ
jgi:hypothetical protein